MNSLRIRAAVVGALLVGVAACGGADPESAPATTIPDPTTESTAAPTSAPTAAPDAGQGGAGQGGTGQGAAGQGSEEDRAAVETAFTSYNAALLARDFDTACGLTAPETSETLVANVSGQLGPVEDCPAAFTAIYAIPEAASITDAVTQSTVLEDVSVTGDTATVSWNAEAAGVPGTNTNTLRRDGDQWLIVDTGQG